MISHDLLLTAHHCIGPDALYLRELNATRAKARPPLPELSIEAARTVALPAVRVIFGYDENGAPFDKELKLDPDACLICDVPNDWAIVAVRPVATDAKALSERKALKPATASLLAQWPFQRVHLVYDPSPKLELKKPFNIIQHPNVR